jgi:hypothetical protein
MESFKRTITVADVTYEVVFVRRPFREGYEVHVDIAGDTVSFGELGLGEQAALEWVKSAVAERLSSKNER